MKAGTHRRIAAALTAASALAGCGSMPSLSMPSLPRSGSASSISAGQSEKDVEAALGKPTEVIAADGGARVMFYNHAPGGGQTEAIVLGADAKVRAVEKRLTRANVGRLTCGQSTSRAVRATLGPPLKVEQKPGLGLEEWMYRFSDIGWTDPILLYVAFSRDGLVRELYAAADQRSDAPTSNIDLLPSGNVNCAR